ncbi:hypothetical protein TNCV_2538731 [Trichonephila clavipes]|nr:hypothetical protein TNCV_2538731 [Trichonephila clavipes]
MRKTAHNSLDDSLRWKTVDRLESDQFQVKVTSWLQVDQKWSPGCRINSKQVVVSAGRSAMVSAEHQYLHRISAWH